ncbi:methyltransferase [Herbidospora sp. NEAU-GS84]|uniref:Methyltransferase n=1 Tax=Herbidospora solisilvae TaxID=2696284 RepID=A0A7C9NKA0_9ACTN|nr:methyltransferase [Herbidospora solisilvae]NAS20576.1 methyltransferase [Herbidospora solisilvae]
MSPLSDLGLRRYPDDPRDPFRAWDAADEYLLGELGRLGGPHGTVVVFGDRWGALVTALAEHRPVQITDSYLTQRATRANLDRLGLPEATLLSTQDAPPARIDTLLVRIPKSLALLEDQLIRLAPAVHEGTTILGAGMVKEIHTSTLALFEKILGPTRTSLAVKKARLIFTEPRPTPVASRFPVRYTHEGLDLVNHAGVFCADRLDIGTRFFLKHLPATVKGQRVVDLGCGNGIVGAFVLRDNPDAEVLFVDESYAAVASARANAPGPAGFLVGDGLADAEPGSADLVLCNPPFHSHQAVTDATAWRMFTQARRALRPGGELRIVGNRHLGYHVKLKRLFGEVTVVAGDPKFVVLSAVRRGPR